jgi:organic radical activating enzyme
MKDKYLSIITNFGCHYTCPYCIVKENNLHIPRTTVEGLNNLVDEIRKNNCNWVSISGGGDPLFDVTNHGDWYNTFFRIIPSDVNIEMHTSIIYPIYPSDSYNNLLWYPNCWDRIVYHLNNFTQLYSIKRRNREIVRVVFVVTEDFTSELIDKIARFVKESDQIDELSFRQMVDDNYETTHYCQDYLEDGHQKDWWYIPQQDYNLYYVENQIYHEFKEFKEFETN